MNVINRDSLNFGAKKKTMNKLIRLGKAIASERISALRLRLNKSDEIKRRRRKYWTNLTYKRLRSLPTEELSNSEVKTLKVFWEEQYGFKLNTIFHKFYKAATGKFDVKFIPEFHQQKNGPIFGEETEDILREIIDNPKKLSYPF